MTESERPDTKVTAISKMSDRPVAKEACLVVIYGLELGKKFNLNRPQIIVGRSSKADIQIDQEAVSRNHCKIINTGNAIMLRDMGSTNGTYVNDETIDEYVLRDGDFIKVGRCIFKFLSGNNIENAYHEEIYRLTVVDGLTQVFNRRYFVETLEREMGRALRYRRDLSLIMLDIDRFKGVNDSFGHLAGDHVLKHLASMIKTRIRREDVLARYGGEEFAIVLPQIDSHSALQFAENLRKLVETAELKFEDAIIPITVSIGVASLRGDSEDALELIKQADTNLFAAKEGGRNRVVTGEEAKVLLPHPSIKPMLAFREAIIRGYTAGATLLAMRVVNSSSVQTGDRDALHIARRQLEDIVLAALTGTPHLVGRGDEDVLLLVVRDLGDLQRVQREITLAITNVEAESMPRLSIVFGPPVVLGGEVATSISTAIDLVPSTSPDATPGWTRQLPLPLGMLVRNLFLNREAGQRKSILAALHEGIARWLLVWLWSESCNLEQLNHERARDGKYASHFRSSITVQRALALLTTAVQETTPIAARLHSYHAWARLFGGELNTLDILSQYKTSDQSDFDISLLKILREMTLIALPIVPGRNEQPMRSRFEGIAEILTGDNSIVATDSIKFSTPVNAGQLYLFAPSSSPIPMEPFACYDRCRDCGSKELFIAESVDKEGRYVYWSPSTNHSIVGRTTEPGTSLDAAAQTQTQLVAPPDILIVTALEEERDAVLARLTYEILPKDDDDVGIFYQAQIPTSTGHKFRVLVTMLQGMGPLQASTRAMYAAMRWRPRYVLMIGIAGGVSKVAALGDVVVASQIADYSVGKVTGKSDRKIYWQVHHAHAALIEAVNAFSTGWEQTIRTTRPGEGIPRRHVGVIASGGDVVAYQTLLDEYAKHWPKLIGVEMEGGGIATALHQSPCNAGFVMIRGVSDHADTRKTSPRVKRWRPYAADAAAAYALGLIESGLIPGGSAVTQEAPLPVMRSR
jgi:two-component system, cell cycle response regulator